MTGATAEADRLRAARGPALIVAGVGLALCGGIALVRPSAVGPGYLVGFLFWTGISIGCLAITLLHHLVGGAWGIPMRRPLEAGAAVVSIMAAVGAPILFGLGWLYPWAAGESIPAHQARWLNLAAFSLRSAFYLALFSTIAAVFARGSLRQDVSVDPRPTRVLEGLAGPCLVAVFFASTFAAIDWSMSLEPEWASSIYGAMILVGEGVASFALMIVVVTTLASPADGPSARTLTPGRMNDLGNLLLAFVMLWAYMAFSQFLIIWSGNLAEEIPWYLRRTGGGWQGVAVFLIAFHFIAPFAALLVRDSKRRPGSLRAIAGTVVVMHLIDLLWLVLPASQPVKAPRIDVLQVGAAVIATLGIGGLWMAAFLTRLAAHPLVPVALDVPEEPHHAAKGG